MPGGEHPWATLPRNHGHLDGLVTVRKHLPLLAATLANQHEPEVDVIVGANLVVAADKHLWKQHEPHNRDIDHMSKRNMPLSVSTTSAATRGVRRNLRELLLFPLFLPSLPHLILRQVPPHGELLHSGEGVPRLRSDTDPLVPVPLKRVQ